MSTLGLQKNTNRKVYTFTASANQIYYSVPFTTKYTEVFLNGAKLINEVDYNICTNRVTLNRSTISGDIVVIIVYTPTTNNLSQISTNNYFDSKVEEGNYFYSSLVQYKKQAVTGGLDTKLIFDLVGNLYWVVTNYYNGTTRNLTSYVYKITPNGTISTFASVTTNGANDTSLIFDTSGNLYWTIMHYHNDVTFNTTSYVYKITPGGSLTTFASANTNGAAGTSLIFDTSGNLYWAVCNRYNGTTYNLTSYVYKITPGGSLTTFASANTNGAAGTSLIFDTSGNLYWAINNQYDNSTYNNPSYVYKITPGGSLTTFASQVTNGASGNSLVFDTSGNLYWAISNSFNNSTVNLTSYIYKITPGGSLTTFASAATNNASRTKIIHDSVGNLYWAIMNYYNGTIYDLISYVYKITPSGSLTTFASANTIAATGCDIIFDSADNLYHTTSGFYDGTTYNNSSYINIKPKQLT